MKRIERTGVAWAVVTLVALVPGSVLAQGSSPAGPAALSGGSGEATPLVTEEATGEEALRDGEVPWRGSQVILGQAVSALSLDRSAELTYNPYYAMSLVFAPMWWATDWLALRGQFALAWEVTNSDITTREDEIWASDLTLGASVPEVWTVP